MTTLVTGGAGFVGSHVAERLLERGDPVVVLDSFHEYYDPARKRANAKRIAALPGARVVEGDVRDATLLGRVFAEHGVTRVAHLAALAGVRASVEEAALYFEVNTLGTVRLLEAARRAHARVFVLGSTSSVYGATPRVPFVEDDAADRPLAPYPASKRSAEIAAHACHHLHGLPVTVLRLFNVYGPAGRPDMMPLRLLRAATTGEGISVYDGGRLSRDWTYVDDTVAGILAALERPLGYEIVNLGFGAPVPLADFIAVVEGLVGAKVRQLPAPAPATEPRVTWCDNAKARRLLGFAPRIDLREGLARTWEWYRAARGGRA
jgi:UDP-glucuronate 4-epimerase